MRTRDYYHHPAVHENNGVRCVDCGGPVLDTPRYCRGVQWRCAACRRALERPMPAPLEPMGLRAGLSPVVNAVVAHLRTVRTATTTELVEVAGVNAPALRHSLEASNRVGYDRAKDSWRLKSEVKA